MRSTTFILSQREVQQEQPPFDIYKATYTVSTLPAYAIEFAEMRVPADWGERQSYLVLDRDFTIDGTKITRSGLRELLPPTKPPILIVHYHGIRDYAALFPHMERSLATRMGEYYEEAEKTFESGAWLSFSLMCGAVSEGLLLGALGKADGAFSDLIELAFERKLVNEQEDEVLTAVRKRRNLIHPAKVDEQYVTRAEAMDMRKVLDDMIKRFSTRI